MIHRVLVSLIALIALQVAVLAQDGDARFDVEFDAGFQAVQRGEYDEAIQAFERCLELRPKHSVITYNIACCYSLKSEVDLAFDWLMKASERGFGDIGENIAHARRDPDLEKLRSDDRFEEFLEGMRQRKWELEEFQRSLKDYWSNPAIYIPSSLDREAPMPLLVVLHDLGSRKEEVVSGPWRQVADQLGMALLAPSGRFAISRRSNAGMAWFDSMEAYSLRHWSFERTIGQAVQSFKKAHELNLERVVLAGEGQGALVAFNVALTSPGLYRSVLVVDGMPRLDMVGTRGNLAGRMGLRAHFIQRGRPNRQAPNLSIRKEDLDRLRGPLERWGIDFGIQEIGSGDLQDEAYVSLLVGALRGMDSAPAIPTTVPSSSTTGDESEH